MKNRLNIHTVWGFAVVALLLAQFGCSSKSSENAATAGPTPSPSVDTALTSASPTPDATSSPAANPDSASASNPTGSNAAAPAPTPPRVYTMRAGARITIFTASELSTKTAKDGDRFTASLARPIVDGDWVIAKKGATVEGVVVNSDPGGRVKGRASMTVKLSRLQLADGRTVELSTSSYTKEAKSTKKKDALKIGVGAGIGAAIGAIAGGGKGAAIGAAIGAGAGAGSVYIQGRDDLELNSGTEVTVRATGPQG